MAGAAEAAAEVAPGARFGPEDDQQLGSLKEAYYIIYISIVLRCCIILSYFILL